MISRTTAQFRRAFAELSPEVQQQARRAYRLFKQNPSHPSLRFKPVHPRRPIYSARINPGYRAVGIDFFHNGGADQDRLLELPTPTRFDDEE